MSSPDEWSTARRGVPSQARFFAGPVMSTGSLDSSPMALLAAMLTERSPFEVCPRRRPIQRSRCLLKGTLIGRYRSGPPPRFSLLSCVRPRMAEAAESGKGWARPWNLCADTRYFCVAGFVDGSGAKSAGLLVHDALIAVDGESLAGMSLNDSINRVRGPDGTLVRLTVQRDGQTLDFTVSCAACFIRRSERTGPRVLTREGD